MVECETIDLSEYTPSGEGGTAITYKHKALGSLAGLSDGRTISTVVKELLS